MALCPGPHRHPAGMGDLGLPLRPRDSRSGVARSRWPATVNEIPYPGLTDPHSQLGALIHGGRFVRRVVRGKRDRPQVHLRPRGCLGRAGSQIGATAIAAGTRAGAEIAEEGAPPSLARPGRRSTASGALLHGHSQRVLASIRHQGSRGAILWRLLEQYSGNGRTEFSNREIGWIPPSGFRMWWTTEARLILLRRRLDEQCGRSRSKESAGVGDYDWKCNAN